VAGGGGAGEDSLPRTAVLAHVQVVIGHAGLTIVRAPGHGDVDVVAPERRLDPYFGRGHVPHDVEGLIGGVRRLVGGGDGHRPAEGADAIKFAPEMVWVRACHLDVSRQVIRAPRTDCTGKLQPFKPGQIILNPGGHGERAGVIVLVEDIACRVGIRAVLAQREGQGRRGAVGHDGVTRRGRWPARESNTTTNGEWNEFSASYDADHSLFSQFVVVCR